MSKRTAKIAGMATTTAGRKRPRGVRPAGPPAAVTPDAPTVTRDGDPDGAADATPVEAPVEGLDGATVDGATVGGPGEALDGQPGPDARPEEPTEEPERPEPVLAPAPRTADDGPAEILDFLSAARRHWLVLAGVPVLAALLAVAYVVFSPAVWTATATVTAPSLVGGQFGTQYSGSQAVSQYVSQFQAVATGPSVRRAVADRTQVKSADILAGLTVGQVGASSVMTVTYQDKNADAVAPVTSGIATTTLDTLFGQQVTLGESLVRTSTDAAEKASAAIEAWESENGVVAPDDVYRAKLSQMSNLEQQAITLQANGNSAGAASARAKAAAVQAELKKFGPLLSEYHSLQSTRDAAVASQAQAEQILQSAKAQQMAADPAQVVRVGGVHEAGKADELVRVVLPVTAAGIFLGVVLVVALEMLAASSRRRRTAAGIDEES